jgi:hypothetical protein
MDVNQTIVEYLKVLLSWPVVVLIIILIFRRELGKLPGRLDQVVLGKNNRIIFSHVKSKKITKSLDLAASQPRSSKKQQEQLQKDIDSVFEMGVAIGLDQKGKPFSDITNVELIKDEKGNVTGLQYNER